MIEIVDQEIDYDRQVVAYRLSCGCVRDLPLARMRAAQGHEEVSRLHAEVLAHECALEK